MVTGANRKEKLLASPLAKDLLLETIVLAHEKYDFLAHNFVIMDNHFHFLVDSRGQTPN